MCFRSVPFSTDAGEHWQPVAGGVSDFLRAIHGDAVGRLIAVGDYGTIVDISAFGDRVPAPPPLGSRDVRPERSRRRDVRWGAVGR